MRVIDISHGPAAWAATDTRLLMRQGPGDLGIERRVLDFLQTLG
jgi:hypothetical protein